MREWNNSKGMSLAKSRERLRQEEDEAKKILSWAESEMNSLANRKLFEPGVKP